MSQRQAQKLKKLQESELIEVEKERNYVPKQKMFFAALQDDSDENSDQSDQEDKQQDQIIPKQEIQNSQSKTKKSKKNKNKKKSKQEKIQSLSQSDDEIELVIEQKQEIEFLPIKTHLLDYNKELNKYFKNVDKTEENQNINKKQKHFLNKYKNFKTYYLSYNQKQVKIPIRHQISLKKVECLKMYEFVPEKEYIALYESYIQVKNTNDINMCFQFMQQNPFVVECAYDISQFLSMQGDYKQCNALLENILHFYEDSLGPLLNNFLKDPVPSSQLLYTQWSKTLFDTLLLFINILTKKGSHQAAFEYNKFLYKLNISDPLCSILSLDFTAISAHQELQLQSFLDNYPKTLTNQENGIQYIPSLFFSQALIQKSEEKIQQALYLFPRLYAKLYKKLTKQDIDVPEQELFPFLNVQDTSDQKGMEKWEDVYVERSQGLWKQHIPLLREGIKKGPKACEGQKIQIQFRQILGTEKGFFSNETERVNLNEIEDVPAQQQQNQQVQQGQVMDYAQNVLGLLIGSLMPWNHLQPQQDQDNNQQE